MSKLDFLRYVMSDLRKYISQDMYAIYEVQKRFPSVRIERGVQIKSPDRLFLGENVQIQKGTILHCGGMKWCNYKGAIKIGDNSMISPNNVFFGAGEINIGKFVATSPGVIITAQSRNYKIGLKRTFISENSTYHFEKIIIGDYVSIGSGSVIVPGVTIGEYTIIGAGSVVTKDIPPYSLALGSPARVIKQIKERDKNDNIKYMS